ncbi:GNAT family N-acetyltransferase [Anabaena cylindrica FACHB-243]|uniref:GCN5-related N-acetyltransferase n=1 Tax=Anabaena cylindrica (strain ATCC 27899 / PCC 7122) TaxID=272123 RepID=K9ZQJ9_ANACC|nr:MULTISPECIES: GNAT family N-acetyltransferase [Anabaena]AFZ60812.1 GCN5-related N-acetyltransferase [Anabaena cylindrica PCC 7122]MBD2417112.1 GNAT family N-acetyltransferase [Anabaena cylindrica FACHB-243]MBY5280808.1 GNAT family N-acetyltransferase [Anabaena sp. CCAP 1446/1C]MBY5307084.1 GNAT family N-acetyltransferase [Anabaena sp. CCAP 1446/1C]MCM2406813.1 GNAT family N-acetyltransferase [Anabaena sp. CCAP 1446/1C]
MTYTLEKLFNNFEALPVNLKDLNLWISALYHLKNDPRNKLLILAKFDNNIIGFCCGDIAASEGLYLEVVKGFQRSGLANELINIAKESGISKIKDISPEAFLYWYRHAGLKRHPELKECSYNLDIQKIDNYTELKPYIPQIKKVLPPDQYNYLMRYCGISSDIQDMVWNDRNFNVYVASLSDKLLGFLITDSLGIHYIYVDPLYRRQGIGTKLVVSSGDHKCHSLPGASSFVNFWGRLLMSKFSYSV